MESSRSDVNSQMNSNKDIPIDGELQLTTPKAFVFVLMPFKKEFGDVYRFGIKGAADEVGAYAERVDEQRYVEGTLERIYNQINKADVIVADMTGKNANVFYEVGYAHALGKIVLLLTKSVKDIPFDLKHRPHIIYGGDVGKLRDDLTPWLKWAIAESRSRAGSYSTEQFTVSILDVEVPESAGKVTPPIVRANRDNIYTMIDLAVSIRNGSPGTELSFSHAYLFTSDKAAVRVMNYVRGEYRGKYQAMQLKAHPADAYDGLSRQCQLDNPPASVPYAAVESFSFNLEGTKGREIAETLRLRLISGGRFHDFTFRLEVTFEQKGEDKIEEGPHLKRA
jgi:hypothetical protein